MCVCGGAGGGGMGIFEVLFQIHILLHTIFNTLLIPGASSQGGLRAHDHVICILHRDMTNIKEIHEIEKVVRNISIKCELLYKPNIFSTIGIYRENKYKLRPTIYVSNRKENEDFVVKCVIDENWTYQKANFSNNPTRIHSINALKNWITRILLLNIIYI